MKTKNGKGKKTCQRQCKSDDDCKNERKLCLCDGACGMSCIRPERECPELPDPPHGQVHLTGRLVFYRKAKYKIFCPIFRSHKFELLFKRNIFIFKTFQ